MFQKNERAPFNSHNSYDSPVVSGALGSRSPNLPCTGARMPECVFSSALAKCCLPRCGHQAAALEYLESFACCLCTVCSPSAIQNHHLETNPQKRNLLFCFDLLLQPSRRPVTSPCTDFPALLLQGARCRDMCAAHEPPRPGLQRGGQPRCP